MTLEQKAAIFRYSKKKTYKYGLESSVKLEKGDLSTLELIDTIMMDCGLQCISL